jgi:hypothetical protein
VKHDEVGESSTMGQVLYVFSKGGNQLKTAVDQRTAQNLYCFCKDHHFGNEVDTQVSQRTFTPKVVQVYPGIYHGDGLYPGEVGKPPLFLIRPCRVPSGWYKRRLHPIEVVCLYGISDNVCYSLLSNLK